MSTSGSVRWYDSDEKWPQHGKPWFRAALTKARTAGWQLKGAGGAAHIFGTVYCRPISAGQGCKFIVFSTGNAGESAAADLLRMVGRCPHLSDAQQSALAQASVQLDKVASLLGAVERLQDAAVSQRDAADAWGKADELLNEIAVTAVAVDDLIDRAVDAEAAARLAITDARAALRPLRLDHAGPDELLDRAEQVSTAVRADLDGLPQALTEVAALTTGLAAANAHLTKLRGRSTHR